MKKWLIFGIASLIFVVIITSELIFAIDIQGANKTYSVSEYTALNKIPRTDYPVKGFVIKNEQIPWECPKNVVCSPPIFTDYLIINDSPQDSNGLYVGYGGYDSRKFKIGRAFIFNLWLEQFNEQYNASWMRSYKMLCAGKGEAVNPTPGWFSDLPDECCPGLKHVGTYELKDGECESLIGPGAKCISCGDGVCKNDEYENICTCPEDCLIKENFWQKIVSWFKGLFTRHPNNSCETDEECNINEQGDCVKKPYNPEIFVADHSGCICKDNQCTEAPCDPPCMLG